MDNAKRVIGLDGAASDSLLKVGRFFTKWDGTDDGRAVFREGGRKGDAAAALLFTLFGIRSAFKQPAASAD